MEFMRLSTGELFVEGHDQSPAAIRAALPGFLAAEGMDAWTADEVSPTARLGRVWFSDTAGFTHDCAAHEGVAEVEGCADSRPVIVVHVAAGR